MRDSGTKKVSPALFGFALFCFVLPFVTVSCPGGQATLSGYHLVVGTEIEGEKVNGELLAIVAFLATLVGLAMSFSKKEEGRIGAGVSGGAAAALLLILQPKLSSDVVEQSGGLATASFELGYWLAVLAAAGGAAYSFYLQSRKPHEEVGEGSTPAGVPDAAPGMEGSPGPDGAAGA